MVNETNLIPITKQSEERAKEIRYLGGITKSPKRRWAAQLREWKKKGLTDENYRTMVAWMEEPEASVLDILKYVESIKSHCTTPSQMTGVAQTLIQLHKAHHGEKIKTENIHHIINWEKILKECEISEDAKV